ncbi:MAG: PAS domain S-box protein, partial [Deltaproteobacteria bacterium]|nr:PAS domain S-box protein [Deltaproteobacteria bacterium]
ITERKKAEREIKEGKEFLESVIESSRDGIAIADEKGYIISVNTALEKMCSFRKEELIGKHASTLTIEDKDLRGNIRKKVGELFEKGFTFYEAKHSVGEGNFIDVECSLSMIKDNKGDYIAGVSIIRDITERKRAEEKLRESEEKQISEVDEDARLLYKNGQAVAGYNVQIAVDEKHKLLVVCEVTNEGNDQRQLEPMARKAQEKLESDTLDVVADGGYFNQLQIKACVDAGITPFIPERDWNARVRVQGRFTQEDFQYNPELDGYECPAGQLLNLRSTYMRNGKRIFRYGSQVSICAQCTLKGACLPDKTPFRQISRWEHEHVLIAHRERMAQQGSEKMRLRAAIAEHPFGTLKQLCGWTHFLLRGIHKVSAEMDLLMLSYNFKRVLNILGVEAFRTYCLQRVKNDVQDVNIHSQNPSFVTFVRWTRFFRHEKVKI